MTVNVPPRSSSGFSVPACAPSARRLHLGVELVEREPVGAVDDRDDEPLLGLDRDADVVAVEQHELPVLDARIQLRELAQRFDDRAENERDEALQVDVREVALLDPGHGGDLAMRARQVLEHLPADAVELYALALCGLRTARRHGRPPR